MSDSISAYYDDQEMYEAHCEHFAEKPQYGRNGGGVDPYCVHAKELRDRYCDPKRRDIIHVRTPNVPAVLTHWRVKEGEHVRKDQSLCRIDIEKAKVGLGPPFEWITSPVAGRIARILVKTDRAVCDTIVVHIERSKQPQQPQNAFERIARDGDDFE